MNLDDLMQLYDFSEKTVVITGGAGILGGEMVCALVGCSANVAILDRAPEQADRIIDRCDAGPGRLMVIDADVLDLDRLMQADAAIRSEFGCPADMLINAAGGNDSRATTSEELSFFDLPEEALRNVLDLNILGTFLPCQVFGRGMAMVGRGAIVNISSMNAMRPLTRIPAYSAAKAGVSNFTQWLAVYIAREYSPNIRVNAIAPGFFFTEQNRFLLMDESGDLTKRGQAIIDHIPMGRFGSPEDLLGTTLWLLSDAARFVTGIVVPVDGGFSAFSGV
ncbi:MAG: D-mannonate oxidoreductase [Chloroflexi bacterium RBG_16_48_8]|nr:MAG: D-mannonate oxidoreductase [Chloroflexi bacterium RBG_16_48_8]